MVVKKLNKILLYHKSLIKNYLMWENKAVPQILFLEIHPLPENFFRKINLSCGNSVPLCVYFYECINYISERSSSRYEYCLEGGDEEKDGADRFLFAP